MPQCLHPYLAGLLDLTRQRRPGALFSLGRTHHHPALPLWRLRSRCPPEWTVLLPGVVGPRQSCPCLLGGVGDAIDPAHACQIEPCDVLGTVEAAIRHEDRGLIL